MKKTIRTVMTFILFALMSSAAMVGAVVAAGSGEIDIKVDGALTLFKKDVTGGAEFLKKAKAVLVFPDVIKGGFIVGGEYGKGAQQYAIVMVF